MLAREFKSLRQEGIVDLYQKQEAIYDEFTKSVGSVTHGVKFPQQRFITDVSVSYWWGNGHLDSWFQRALGYSQVL